MERMVSWLTKEISMANLTVQVINKSSGKPVSGIKVALRPMRFGVDYDNVTDGEGMADFMIVEPGPAEFYVAGVLKAELEVTRDANVKMFGGVPFTVEI
jgi:hypothetical protein